MALPTPEQIAKKGTEEAHQTAVFAWVRLHKNEHPGIHKLHHIPNGGRRGDTPQTAKIEGGKMKAQGVRKGIPDMNLPIARGGYFGLWVELKVDENTTSKDQNEVIDELREDGYAVAIVYGWEAVIDCVLQYLAMPPTAVQHITWMGDGELKA